MQEAMGPGHRGAFGAVASGNAPVPLSVLDLAAYGAGATPAEALATTTMVAQLADRLGFHRFWVGENHGSLGLSSSSPAVLMAHLAARTDTIRLGSGAVILPNHAPLVIAEQFGMLEALHPGRIDLGVGRATVVDPATAGALRRNTADFPDQLAELMGFLNGSFPADHPYADVRAIPGRAAAPGADEGVTVPAPWLLGTSERSGRLAGRLGLPFAFGAHLVPAMLAESALAAYRESFTASATLERPHTMISVMVTTADTAAEADRLARREMSRALPGAREPVPTTSLRCVERHAIAAQVKERVQVILDRMVCGTPEQVRDELDRLVKNTRADELMIISHVPTREPRLRVYELIADIYGLTEHSVPIADTEQHTT